MVPSSRDSCGDHSQEQMMAKLADLLDLVAKLGDHVALESFSHFTLITRQLEEYCEDMEWLQLTVDNLTAKVDNLNLKMDRIEIKVETVTLGVLKEVFEILETSPPSEQVVTQFEELLDQTLDSALPHHMEVENNGKDGNLQAEKNNSG